MTLEETVEDQLISLGQQADAIVRLQKEVARLRDNLHTIAADQFDTLEECRNFANTCWRASGSNSGRYDVAPRTAVEIVTEPSAAEQEEMGVRPVFDHLISSEERSNG